MKNSLLVATPEVVESFDPGGSRLRGTTAGAVDGRHDLLPGLPMYR